jgi:hypothetical protein
MSTNYYRFKSPITRVQVETKGRHDHVTVWINHQNAGTLVVDNGTGKDLLWMLGSNKRALHCYTGKARCVVKDDPGISDDEYVVSECGEVITVGEVLKGRTLVTE